MDLGAREKREKRTDEQFWVSHYHFLVDRGYTLPSRYHPDWVPMRLKHRWLAKTTRSIYGEFQDEVTPFRQWVREAVRGPDSYRVVIKSMTPREWSMTEYLNKPEFISRSENHTVPILDSFPVPGDSQGRFFVVMPFLRAFDSPNFHCRKEFADACFQILEGLKFMHDLNVSHGDSCTMNFLMDSSEVCPKGYLFARPDTMDCKAPVPYVHRCRVPSPLRYYIIDFECSAHYPNGRTTARARDARCQIKTSPEWNSDERYNPFPLDVYNVGATFLEICGTGPYSYFGLEEFAPIFQDMTDVCPSSRPTVHEVVQRLQSFLKTKDEIWFHSRIWEKSGDPPPALVRQLWAKVPKTVMLPIC